MISGAIVSSRTTIAQTAVRANPSTRFTESSPFPISYGGGGMTSMSGAIVSSSTTIAQTAVNTNPVSRFMDTPSFTVLHGRGGC